MGAPATQRVCKGCGMLSPAAGAACEHCGAAFKSDLRWKVPVIILMFVAAIVLSIILQSL